MYPFIAEAAVQVCRYVECVQSENEADDPPNWYDQLLYVMRKALSNVFYGLTKQTKLSIVERN
ncbi:MAG: hypothetical protein HY788_19225 [Deltaproteobacteria bacterium]|nr:hypothetical protein [Deltaproteobacteria bacterium]